MKPTPLGLLFIGLNGIDAGTTAYLLAHGAREANPVMAAILSLGIPSFVAFKLSAAALVAGLLLRFKPGPLRAITAAFTGIVAWQAFLCAST